MFVGKTIAALLAFGVAAQASVVTVALGPIDASDGQSEGEIIGVGDEGTTLILSQPTRSDSANPGTLTMVQDATHVSIHLVATGDITEQIDVDCGLDGSNADCTEVLVEASGPITTAVTFVTTVDAGFQTVSVTSGTAPAVTDTQTTSAAAASSTQSSSSGTSSSDSSSGADHGIIVSMLGGFAPFLLALFFGV